MKKTFLECVAEDLLSKFGNDLSRVVVVFPNKRASLFLNEYLARLTDRPLWSPSYLTISQLFCNYSNLNIGDDIKLICDLHKVYTVCTGSSETLDHFYGWGQLMLSDFDDIDKNMVDADHLFNNISNIHELDDISYLTEKQREALKKFFVHFSEEYNTELKRRFLQLWKNFGKIYHQYNEHLKAEGLAYEGALYRSVVTNQEIDFNADTYVFVGFNMLQQVEQKLFARLVKTGKAKFYWDFDTYYMEGVSNEAGTYIRQYLSAFPNELSNKDKDIYDNLNKKKNITFISASTETIQARYVSEWLKQKDYIQAGRKTAIVLCNEALLQTVIHSLPSAVENVNITTGFPLSQSPVYAFVNSLIVMQTIGRVKNTDKYRLHYIRPVLRHPYALLLSEKSTELLSYLEAHWVYYPSKDELSKDAALQLLFSDWDATVDSVQGFNSQLLKWILTVLQALGKASKDTDDQLLKEAVFRMYTLFNRLSELIDTEELNVDMVTLQRLITQLIQTTSIPFHGEPVIGLQVMGMLETRNLDFDNLLLLSCNEGCIPKSVNDASFIPYSIRKAYGLTTIDNKVAIYSYYFHRLLQRAKNITLLYNNSTEDGHTGEMSRFMLQLMVESGHFIDRKSIQAGQIPVITRPQKIEKTDTIMAALLALKELSPTAINRYLRCPLQFFYYTLAGLKEADNETDEIDNRTFGNIFHRCSQLIYEQLMDKNQVVRPEALKSFNSDKSALQRIVDQVFNEELFKVKNKQGHPEYNGLQLINRGVIISYLKQLLQIDKRLAPFSILAMEQKFYTDVEIPVDGDMHSLRLGGYIDRLDEVTAEQGRLIRVVDYKTGRIPIQKVQSLDDVFSGLNVTTKHSDYYLQALLYSVIVRQSQQWNAKGLPVSPALLFIQQASAEDYDPILALGKEKITDVDALKDEFWERMQLLLSEIFNKNLPFEPTLDKSRCSLCPYKKLCGA